MRKSVGAQARADRPDAAKNKKPRPHPPWVVGVFFPLLILLPGGGAPWQLLIKKQPIGDRPP